MNDKIEKALELLEEVAEEHAQTVSRIVDNCCEDGDSNGAFYAGERIGEIEVAFSEAERWLKKVLRGVQK